MEEKQNPGTQVNADNIEATKSLSRLFLYHQEEKKDAVNDAASIATQTTATGITKFTKITGISSLSPSFLMNDPLIVMMGVGTYDSNSFLDLPGVTKDYDNTINTFAKIWKYRILYKLDNNDIVYSNNIHEMKQNYKLEWSEDDICLFVEQARQHVVLNKHDGIIFAITGHGDKGKVLYESSGDKIDLQDIFDCFLPESQEFIGSYEETPEETNHLFKIPKIFLIDICRGNKKSKPIHFEPLVSQLNPDMTLAEAKAKSTHKRKRFNQMTTRKKKHSTVNQLTKPQPMCILHKEQIYPKYKQILKVIPLVMDQSMVVYFFEMYLKCLMILSLFKVIDGQISY